MRSGFKVVVLIIAFLIPISIFLFLKFFGKNEFEVRPFFSNGHESLEGCPDIPKGPYAIPQYVLNQLGWSSHDSLTLFAFNELRSGSDPFGRIQETFKSSELKPIRVSLTHDSMSVWKRCYFYLAEPNDMVLVDANRRIRGFYQSGSREELDSLIMESKIILHKY